MSQILNDLRIGEETKLSERFMGKQLYAKLIDFGALPPAGEEKAVAHGITGMDQFGIDYGRSYVDQGNGNRHALTYPNAVPNGFWRTKVNETEVSIQSGQDRSAFIAVICVWYTKANELPDQPEQPDNGIDYSLEEQWTGKRWINGKKIYQKTLSCGSLPNNTAKLVPLNIANMETKINLWGMSTDGSRTINLPHVSTYSASPISCTIEANTSVRFITATNYSTYTATYVTIQYTCTDR